MNNVKAIQKLNETELKLGLSSKKSWHDMYSDSAYIFVGGLDYGLTEGDVLSVFSQYGEIVNINLVRDKKTGKSKGFCFLCYEDQRSTILAVDNFNGIKMCGRTIRVDHVKQYRRPKDEDGNEIIEKGCAPKTPTPSPTPSESSSPEPDVKKKTKKRKHKKKKKIRKRRDSSNSEEEKTILSEKEALQSDTEEMASGYVYKSSTLEDTKRSKAKHKMRSQDPLASLEMRDDGDRARSRNDLHRRPRSRSTSMERTRRRGNLKRKSRSRSISKERTRERSDRKRRPRSRSISTERTRERSDRKRRPRSRSISTERTPVKDTSQPKKERRKSWSRERSPPEGKRRKKKR